MKEEELREKIKELWSKHPEWSMAEMPYALFGYCEGSNKKVDFVQAMKVIEELFGHHDKTVTESEMVRAKNNGYDVKVIINGEFYDYKG